MNLCWAIIPVKHLDSAKSRLGPAVSLSERVSLSLKMLGRVLAAVSDVEQVTALVVSRDSRALGLAVSSGVQTLEDRWNGLNPCLEGAAQWCAGKGARSLLVLHADLPLITPGDIRALLDMGLSTPSVVLAPCRRNEGTNALFMRPPGIIPFAFGPGSFTAHQKLAFQRLVAAAVYRSPTIALDLDTEEDLQIFRSEARLQGVRH